MTSQRFALPRVPASLVAAVLLVASLMGPVIGRVSPAYADNPVTPGNFTGYGFDQCLAPSQDSMDRWLNYSPFWAVGIYISGDSRACRNQPNLTPEWVSTQLAKGWRLLPITLGPQASCQPRFPRYGDDKKIDPTPGANGTYYRARKQGEAEADKAVTAAQALGISAGSTLWYDLEGFDSSLRDCRESALRFLSGWTYQLGQLGYVSGVYSGASSGIKMLDDARINRPDAFHLPARIWIARWDGVANTSTTYISDDGWVGGRVKQYLGGHDETWGGVRINIDRNFLDLGKGSVAAAEDHCGGVRVNFWIYDPLQPGVENIVKVKALQCLLTEQGVYAGPTDGTFGKKLTAAVNVLAGSPRPCRHGVLVPQSLDEPARRRRHEGPQDWIRGQGRTPPAARPECRRALTTRRQGRVRRQDASRGEVVAGQGRSRGDWGDLEQAVGGPTFRPPLTQANAVCTSPVKNPRPSVPGPHNSSTACSGCGMRPTTLPRSLLIPAIARIDPLGFSPR